MTSYDGGIYVCKETVKSSGFCVTRIKVDFKYSIDRCL